MPFLASHVLHEIARNKTQILLNLLNQPITVLQIQVSKTQNLFEVICEKSSTNIEPMECKIVRTF